MWAELEIDKRGYAGGWESQPVAKALNLTPPQALREREERVGALERVVEAARAWHESCIDIPPHNDAECEASERFQEALAELDATKGAPDA